jgi:hypothetical protein
MTSGRGQAQEIESIPPMTDIRTSYDRLAATERWPASLGSMPS